MVRRMYRLRVVSLSTIIAGMEAMRKTPMQGCLQSNVKQQPQQQQQQQHHTSTYRCMALSTIQSTRKSSAI